MSADQQLVNVNDLSPVEIADFLQRASHKSQIDLFKGLDLKIAVSVFELLPLSIQKTIIKSLEPQKIAALLEKIAPDDLAAFLENLSKNTVNDLLKLLPAHSREEALTLLGYPKDSVGRLMTPHYIAVKMDWSVKQVLDYVRVHGKDSETINVIYVIDEVGKLIDDIRIREFLLAPLDNKVSDLTDKKFISLLVSDKAEKAVETFSHYNRIALPVVDQKTRLIGIVTIDDVLDLINQETTKDIQQIGGTVALEYPYLHTSFFDLMRKRASWLVLLFIGELFTATAMGYFDEEIAKAVVLTLFLPLIISSGGNSGSQASTLIIRALSIGEITLKDWWKIMQREILSGIFLGTMLGLIGFMRISLWSAFSDIYGAHWLLLGFTVLFSLIGVVLWGTITGAMLPLLLKKLKFDPATSSAPLVATLVDVTGIIIYFVTASLFLKGTLL